MATDERFSQNSDAILKEDERGTTSAIISGPVTDWATDFSHMDPQWAADPYRIQDDLRERCPIAHTDRFGGAWLPTRYEHVAEIAHAPERFSSRAAMLSNFRPPRDAALTGPIPPITADPPIHHDWRKLLLPAFTKGTADKLEPALRKYCHSLIDALDGKDVVDIATDYAQFIPIRMTSDMLGFPPEDGPRFREFVEMLLEGVNLNAEERMNRLGKVYEYIFEQIRDHIANPRDDITSYLINAELHGEKLGPRNVAGSIALLLIAGVDTTWSAIGASLWHLANTPADRERLVAEPGLIPTAIEEFLRAYAPVSMSRLVNEDMHWHGVDMKADDWILLSFPAANRDPAQFDRADEVIIDRQPNRHVAFGLGIHRCLGSHLARMELRVALEVWLERFPVFTLTDPSAVTWSVGQVRGPRHIPVRIG